MEKTANGIPILGNRYHLLETLGTGGMAVVYRARDTLLERTVAVKVLRQDFSKEEGFRERFLQEAKAAANLSHPNIVTVFDLVLDAGRIYIVMEYIPGKDLKSLIKEKGVIPVADALHLIIQACAGIGYAHRMQIVHCDVKPHNMLVTSDQRLKVTDFGIARALASIQPDEHFDVVWGSPQYFSPEQAAGLAPSPASDVYSLGVILYEMVTGRLPFISNNAEELAAMHREAIPIPPHEINPTVPLQLEQIILKVLSKEPSSRYRTAEQMCRVLINLQAQLDLSLTSPQIVPLSQSLQPPPLHIPVEQPIGKTSPRRIPTAPKVDHNSDFHIDWGTIMIGLLALFSVGGLIPFWLYIYLTLTSPIR
jgi:serine/threonine protein kinase